MSGLSSICLALSPHLNSIYHLSHHLDPCPFAAVGLQEPDDLFILHYAYLYHRCHQSLCDLPPDCASHGTGAERPVHHPLHLCTAPLDLSHQLTPICLYHMSVYMLHMAQEPDDLFIIHYAWDKGAHVVSNDMYRDWQTKYVLNP